MWLEHLARGAAADRIDLPCEFTGTEIDWRDTLAAVIDARLRGVAPKIIARAFHRSLARAIADASVALAGQANVDTGLGEPHGAGQRRRRQPRAGRVGGLPIG